jgi:hypothetical protein
MVSFSTTLDEGQDCFRVETPHGTYIYQKTAGGFSSLLDKDGNDWLNFHPDPSPDYPRSAGNAFRGMPNLVFGGEEDGYGHPGFAGCTSEQIGDSSIQTTSLCKRWQWQWGFFEKYAKLTMLRVNPDRAYWFLYEGTPAGRYEPHQQFWGTSEGVRNDKPNFYTNDAAFGSWSWVYMGDTSVKRTFFMMQSRASERDMFGFLSCDKDSLYGRDGMIVCGFGRNESSKPKLRGGGKTFYVGLVDKAVNDPKTHTFLEQHLRTMLE